MNEVEEICRRQRGALTHAQAVGAGLTRSAVQARVASGRWRRLGHGVHVTFTGPITPATRRWAVLLAGPGAVLSHRSAAEEAGFAADADGPVHVTVPASSHRAAISGLVIHRSPHVEAPASHPPPTPDPGGGDGPEPHRPARDEPPVPDLPELTPGRERWLRRGGGGTGVSTGGRGTPKGYMVRA